VPRWTTGHPPQHQLLPESVKNLANIADINKHFLLGLLGATSGRVPMRIS
jgi:hypothetical protein